MEEVIKELYKYEISLTLKSKGFLGITKDLETTNFKMQEFFKSSVVEKTV